MDDELKNFTTLHDLMRATWSRVIELAAHENSFGKGMRSLKNCRVLPVGEIS